MATEPSSNSNNATLQPSSSSGADSFIGSFIHVISKSEIRYEGILYHLNLQDSTLGLKNVRSFGTEGRRTDGQEVPPSEKVFEYILFRGSDIKDLKVITNSPVQQHEKVYNDPTIIESNYHAPPSSTSSSISVAPGYSTSEPSVLNARSYSSSMLPSHPSGNQMEWGSSQLTHDRLTQWPGYSAAPLVSEQRTLSSTLILHPLQKQSSSTTAMPNISNNIPSEYPLVTPSSICLNATESLTSEQLSMSFIDPLPSKPSHSFHNSTLINSNGLVQPFPLAYEKVDTIEAPGVNEVVPDHVSSLPLQFLPYPTSSVSGQISNSSIRQQEAFLPPNLSHPIVSEYSLSNNVVSSTSLNFLSSVTQHPLLPLPPASQKLQSPLEFTEEFDFEAMNEKFKKDVVWGYLGKKNQRENIDRVRNATSSHEFVDDNSDLISKSDPKPAYNKDDFFDSISCNSLGRGARDAHDRFFERVKLNSETFGNFQRRSQFGYGGQRPSYGQHRGPYDWGRGYNHGYRGREHYYV